MVGFLNIPQVWDLECLACLLRTKWAVTTNHHYHSGLLGLLANHPL